MPDRPRRSDLPEPAVAYLSLYRKHRPRTFSEVVGQEHVTRTLINAITEDRLHHAYLFTGQRGTGKTSTARILAAAVNCENGPTPNPCGTCEQCVSIVAGRNVDVVELDMASNGGVDDARDLRDRAVFAPAAGRKKVYILDEVHMASTAAFNALLKVVEEPPPHVLFAMATTDPQKVLPTIMSRVQRLDLRRVTGEDLTGHLRHLGAIEGYTLDDEAAAAIAAAGDGSVRDTLSILEQVIAFAADDDARVDGVLPVTGGHVTRVLGATPFEMVVEVVDKIADADVGGALTAVQQLLDGGHD
ncbi:MAG: DNA polymerase-3 subunit gamma/tau, partial [Nitriliruptoraceae bacterium]